MPQEAVACWESERPYVHRYARSIGADYDDAEDICQEVLFALVRYWPLGHKPVRAFLARAAKTTLLHLRWESNHRHPRVELFDSVQYEYQQERLAYEEPRGNDQAEIRYYDVDE